MTNSTSNRKYTSTLDSDTDAVRDVHLQDQKLLSQEAAYRSFSWYENIEQAYNVTYIFFSKEKY